MFFQLLTESDDAALAVLIRRILKAHRLDIPGTVYYDEALDHLSSFYNEDPEHRAYYVLVEEGEPAGGIGLAELPFFENCCELQKLYLSESLQGRGIGYQMISLIEEQARLRGYQRIYLETHTNLEAAIHIYEKSGYREIPRPEAVVHSTMNRFYLKEL
ncbi:MAG: GNAT family N-acetyltransferase [Eubacteriales bacterium]|nr:GNAT family N-acetyltransferase [Eubacteriales bacterium]